MPKFKVLSTKILSPSLKDDFTQKGIDLIENEFISIRPINTEEKHKEVLQWITHPKEIAVIFTSQHSVKHTTKHFRSDDTFYIPWQWKVFCLEGITKEIVIESLPARQIVSTASNALELAERIIENGSFKKVIFFCGNNRRDELPALLYKKQIEVIEVIVYETIETPAVSTADTDAILFFSPSAVKSFFSINKLSNKTVCFAIGVTTANAIADFTDNRIITSESSSQEMMMASLWFYLKNINCYK